MKVYRLLVAFLPSCALDETDAESSIPWKTQSECPSYSSSYYQEPLLLKLSFNLWKPLKIVENEVKIVGLEFEDNLKSDLIFRPKRSSYSDVETYLE